jgi:pimeloyl-ACP methyl ester carboxylesterase
MAKNFFLFKKLENTKYKSMFLIVIGGYLLLVITVYFLQRSLQYFPSGTAILPANFQEKKIITDDQVELLIWENIPKDYKKIIVYFHGNAGNLSDRSYRFETFINNGYGVVALSYRGYYGSNGKPSEAGFILDAQAVLKYLQNQKYSKNDLILFGESIGSGVVCQIAQNKILPTQDKILQKQIAKNQALTNQNFLNNNSSNIDSLNKNSSNPNFSSENSSSQNSSNLNSNINNSTNPSIISKENNSKNSIAVENPSSQNSITNSINTSTTSNSDDFFMTILESPFYSIVEIAQKTYPILPVKLMLKDRFDSHLFAPYITSKVLIFHGDQDQVVSLSSGQKLYNTITSKKKFLELQGASHVDTNPEFIIQQIEEFR